MLAAWPVGTGNACLPSKARKARDKYSIGTGFFEIVQTKTGLAIGFVPEPGGLADGTWRPGDAAGVATAEMTS